MYMLISFVIPLYNCEALIGRCLDSIFSSDVDTGLFEVVIVDDGSRDGSVAVVRDYARKHSNITLVCQRNAGASAARNAGLRRAGGRYVWFADADDHIASKFFQAIIARLGKEENTEMFSFNYQEVMTDKVIDRQLFSREDNMTGVQYYQRYANSYLWNKIMRRDMIRHEFLDGTKNLEDLYFCLQNVLVCHHITVLPLCGYYYDHTNATSTSLDQSLANLEKRSDDTLTIQRCILTDIVSLPADLQAVYRSILTETTAGHLYSLLCYYPVRRLRFVLKKYRQWHLYPIVSRTCNKRMNLFIRLANHQWLLYLGIIIKNIIRGR